jgi:hypothetical protein
MHLIEFHDRPWFPKFLRDFITDDMETILNFVNVYGPVAPALRNALRHAGTNRVVDLCSGGGGPWRRLWREFDENALAEIWLTDKYPNIASFERTMAAAGKRICFRRDSIDALKIPGELQGFRTIFNSFHHFAPDDARAILQAAADSGEGIGIFETPGRHMITLLLILLIPLADLAMTPFARPFRWTRLLWTYLLPVIPLVLLVDGILSCLRVYSPAELNELTRHVRPRAQEGAESGQGFEWNIGVENSGPFRVPVTYLTGYPKPVAGTIFTDNQKDEVSTAAA